MSQAPHYSGLRSSYGWRITFADLGFASKLAILTLQLGLHYVLPYALVHFILRQFGVGFPWMLAFSAELMFCLWMAVVKLPSLRAPQLEADIPRIGIPELYERSMQRVCAADRLGYPWQRWLSGWFLGSSPDDIRRENVVEWIAANFYNKKQLTMDAAERAEVDRMASDMSTRLGWSLQDGRNPAVRSIQLLMEPLGPVLQRSLLQYLATSALPRVAAAAFFCVLGLRRARCSKTGLYYWWRAPAEYTTEPDLLLFHGLCGFTGYIPLVCMLLWKSSRGAVLFELEDISLCLNQGRPPTRAAVLETARAALNRLQMERRGVRRSCLVISHSLGTGPATWLLEEPPAPMAGAVFIDPIVVMLEMPDVAHSFLYRAPRSAFEWLCFLWCTSEPGMQFYFHRRFYWHQHTLDPKVAAQQPVLFCLSECDQIVPSHIVHSYVAQEIPSAETVWWKGIGHTYFMAFPGCYSQILQWIKCCPHAREAWIGG